MRSYLNAMYRHIDILQELEQLQQEELELRQAYAQKCELIAQKRQDLLSELTSCCSKATRCTTNGRARAVTQQSNVNEDNYAVVLNLKNHSLRYRKDPEINSPLIEGKLKGIGPHRMKIFAYMLEHPDVSFHGGNIANAYCSYTEKLSDNTFTKAIGVFRKVLGQHDTSGPYIVVNIDWEGITGKTRGHVYRVNSKWRYLVIRSL